MNYKLFKMSKEKNLELLRKLAKDTFEEIHRQIQGCKEATIKSDEDIETVELYEHVFGDDLRKDLRNTIKILVNNLIYYIHQYEMHFNVTMKIPFDLLDFRNEIEMIGAIEQRNQKITDVEAID